VEYVKLGRSDLVSSVVALGGGGPSRLGLSTGSTRGEAIALIRRAFDLGITMFDSKGIIGGSDEIIGEALRPVRQQVLISTKVNLAPAPGLVSRYRMLHRVAARTAETLGLVADAAAVRSHVERTLRALASDRLEVLHLHAVVPGQYAKAVERALPVLQRLKADGLIRAIGITESFTRDPGHETLTRALGDDFPDVVMTGFNMLNRSARSSVLPAAANRGVGVMGMFAVRQGLRSEADLVRALHRGPGALPVDEAAQRTAAFMRLLRDWGVPSLSHAAYRYCRHEPGIDVILVGTGNPTHLEQNVAAALAGPLPEPVLRAVEALT